MKATFLKEEFFQNSKLNDLKYIFTKGFSSVKEDYLKYLSNKHLSDKDFSDKLKNMAEESIYLLDGKLGIGYKTDDFVAFACSVATYNNFSLGNTSDFYLTHRIYVFSKGNSKIYDDNDWHHYLTIREKQYGFGVFEKFYSLSNFTEVRKEANLARNLITKISKCKNVNEIEKFNR